MAGCITYHVFQGDVTTLEGQAAWKQEGPYALYYVNPPWTSGALRIYQRSTGLHHFLSWAQVIQGVLQACSIT